MRHSPCVIALAVLLSSLDPQFSDCLAAPLGTAFTYQGQLGEGGQPANGLYDLRFAIYDAASGGNPLAEPNTNSPVSVANGLFTVTLDFGAGVFTGDARWLAVGVRTNGGGAFTPLTPRQRLTPAPYALVATAAGAVPASGLIGVLPDARLSANVALLDRGADFAGAVSAPGFFGGGLGLSNLNASRLASGTVADARLSANVALLDASQSFTGQPAFNGGSSGSTPPFTVDSTNRVNNLNADLLDGLEKSAFWQTSGNGGHPAEPRFLGTTELEPLEIRVNNMRALRVEFAGDSAGLGGDPDSTPDGAPNLIGGAPCNFVASDVVGATIAGGGATNFHGVAYTNSIQSNLGVIGGGGNNGIALYSDFSSIGGGRGNSVANFSSVASIAGGQSNAIALYADYSSIGGGRDNAIGDSTASAGIAGGQGNVIESQASYGTIAGGQENEIAGGAEYATIGGGCGNRITGANGTIPGGCVNRAAENAFAAGTTANASHIGSFVWADSYFRDVFNSFADHSVSFRCYGGVRFTSGDVGANQTVKWTPGSASWSFSSDRNLKEGVALVDSAEVLDKLARLPISEWNYKGYPQRHIGPMAQDFHALFPLNDSDTTLNDADLHGVALAAIQGLNQKLAQKETEITALKDRLERLEHLMEQAAK